MCRNTQTRCRVIILSSNNEVSITMTNVKFLLPRKFLVSNKVNTGLNKVSLVVRRYKDYQKHG